MENISFRKELLGQICSSSYLDTPIRVSCCLGDWTYPFTETLKLLLVRGCDPNAKFNKSQPLHILCNNSHAMHEQIELLINHGADVDCTDCKGFTPLDYATKTHNYKNYYGEKCNNVVKLLIREGAKNYGNK